LVLAVDFTWPLVTAIGIILFVICFLAVLWSKREWNTRKIRVGMFLEREYRGGEDQGDAPSNKPADEAPTQEWPRRGE
jgi:hypothetical protein